jgi:Flp pilus assembly protein TadD
VYSDARTASQYETAALLDPGSYRIKMKLAQIYQDRGSCERVRDAAGAALKLFPSAPDPARMLRACGVRVRAPR